ncbi:MAG: RNA methyltransferase [Acetobacteraceae bacterium]
MKPPHGNRPGGPPRPPSDRGGPPRGPGGQPSRPFGTGGGGQRGRDQQGQQHGGGFQQRPQRDGGKPGQGGGPREGFKPRHGGPPHRSQDHNAPRHTPEAPKGTVWLYGLHAVAAALANPARRLRRLLLTEEAEATLAARLSPPWALSVERVERGRLDHLLGRDAVHQGAALLADPLPPPSLASVLEKPGPIVVLDQVTDPRNVGAIMRSAAAFGVAAVITQDRNAPEETGSLAKAASGALETMPLLRAVNIARTLIALKAANVWCVGLDAAGPPLAGPAFAGRRVALVLGAEGEGLRRLTRETCDEVAGLTIKGAVESLNVSAAAAVALYELTRS